MAEGKNAILLGMSQWNSNDLVEQIETMGKMGEQRVAKHPVQRTRPLLSRPWGLPQLCALGHVLEVL